MHAASEGPAEHHAALPVEAHPLELCAAFLAVRGHLAYADLVAHHLHWLAALGFAAEKREQICKIHRE